MIIPGERRREEFRIKEVFIDTTERNDQEKSKKRKQNKII